MLLGSLPDLRETQSGKDLIQIGKEEGHVEGKIEGKIEGKQEDLLLLMEAKFGTLPSDTNDRVTALTTVDQLKDMLLQVLKADALDDLQW